MIDKIFCESYNCVHNDNGACASGIIDVKNYVDSTYEAAYCNSFAAKNSLRDMVSQSMPNSNGSVFVRGVSMSEQNTREVSSFIGCSATDCVHNANRMCCAYSVHIEEPHLNGGTLSFCDTYEKNHSLPSYVSGHYTDDWQTMGTHYIDDGRHWGGTR